MSRLIKSGLALAVVTLVLISLVVASIWALVVGVQSGFDREWAAAWLPVISPIWFGLISLAVGGYSTKRRRKAEIASRVQRINQCAETMIARWRAEGWWVEVYRRNDVILGAWRHSHGPEGVCGTGCEGVRWNT